MKIVLAGVLLGVVVSALGEEADVRRMETERIQREIDRVSEQGGGRVVVEKGVHPCGTLYLKSNVDLHLADGAVLLGGDKSEDYDDAIPLRELYSYVNAHTNVGTRKAFIYAENVTNVAITGKGVIDSQGPKFFDHNSVLWERFWAKPPCMRPRMVVMMHCKGIRFEETTFKDCPTWTMWLRHCENIVASNIRVVAEQKMINSDGIDFDACRNVRVGDSYFKTGDDCLILRAIRHAADEGREVVTENVVVSNCYLNSTCQGVRIGCPSDDLVRNAVFRDITFDGFNGILADQQPWYLEAGDSGRFRTENILFENWTIRCFGHPISVIVGEGVTLKDFGHMTFRNIWADSENPVVIRGNATTVVKDVTLENITGTVRAKQPVVTERTQDLRMTGVLDSSASSGNVSPFGVCSHVTRDEDVDAVLARCVEAGIRNVRSDFGWYQLQNKPTEWKSARYTNLLAKARSAGVTILPVTVGGCDFCSPTFGRADDFRLFGQFIGRMEADYKADFPVVEIWNEENCAGFWPPAPNPAHYVGALRESYRAAKKARPDVRIAFGGTSGIDTDFYSRCYELGAKNCFDIVNIHPYCMPNAPEGWMEQQIGQVRKTMAKYGDSAKPIWITEMGWSTKSLAWPKAERGMLRGAFKAMGLEGRKGLRILAVEQSHPGPSDGWFSDVWRQELPEGAELVNCTYGDVLEWLSQATWDAVVMPFDESAPVHATDALAAYVKGGGCLVDFGGVPGYFGFLKDKDGAIVSGPDGNEAYRQALRIESVFKGCSSSVAANGFDTGADGVKSYPGWRGFGVKYLKKGDAMKPMMVGKDGLAVAALYVFDSDFKGKVFVAGRSLGMVGCATSERTQAAMTVRSAMSALNFGVEKYFVYEFQAPETSPTDQEAHFGLLHRDYTPKPAFHAYKTLIGLWTEGSRKIDTGKWGEKGVYRVAWRRPDGTQVTAVWTGGESRRIPFSKPGERTCLDMFGEPVKGVREGLEIGADPVYVIGDAVFGESVYVAPNGDDANPGTLERPLRTPQGARNLLRRQKAKGGATVPCEVVFADGRYVLSEPLSIGSEDGGSPDCPLTWRAANRGKAVFSGEIGLTPVVSGKADPVWKLLPEGARDKVIAFDLPKNVALPGFRHADCGGKGVEIPLALFQSGRRLESARWPNDGYAKTGENVGTNLFTHDSRVATSGRFRFDDKARLARWAKEPDLWAYGLWNYQWADAKTNVREVDPDKGEMAIEMGPLGFGIRDKGGLFCVFNAVSELDRPGEWVLDRESRRIYVWPLEGERDFRVASSEGLVAVKGAQNLTIDGILFEYARKNAVVLDGATNCAIVASIVRRTSENGIRVAGGRRNCVRGCDLSDLGEGGIVLEGGDLTSLLPAEHEADNNHIHHFGELVANYRPGIQLVGVGCRATHNLIHHTRHQAVGFRGNDHVIAWNVIHDAVCYNSDAGAIYCCQRDWRRRGTVIEHNLIHYTGNKPRCGNCDAIYLDDYSSGVIVRQNVINRAHRGIHLGGGQDNLVERNVFVNCGKPLYLGGRGLNSFPGSEAGKGRESSMFKKIEEDRATFLGELWTRRYPLLKYVFEIDPVVAHDPHYTRMKDNLLVGCGPICRDISKAVWDNICGTSVLVNNLEAADDPGFQDYSHFGWELKDGTAGRALVGELGVAKMGLYESPDRITPAVRFGPDVTPVPDIGIGRDVNRL